MGKLHKLVASTALVSTVALGLATVADADTYTIKKGDTLWDIARNNGTTVEQLMKDNNLTSDLIFPGDQLTYQSLQQRVAEAKDTGAYTVVLGDTLSKIAQQFSTTVDTLVAVNKIEDVNFIKVGQTLNVSDKVGETSKAKSVAKEEVKKETVIKNEEVKKQEIKVVVPTPVVATTEVKKVETKPVVKEEVKKVTPTPVVATTEVKKVETQPVVAVSNKGQSILNAALAQLGRTQDCTMLVTNALKSVGINFHDWPVGYKKLGTVIPASQAQPGDLVYYRDGGLGVAHIAVYAGNGLAVHGGWNGNQTVKATVNLGSGIEYIRVN